MFPRYRRRGWEFIKILTFVALCWFLISFGFSLKSESNFGEILDRNRIEQFGEVSNQNQLEKNFVASDENKFEVAKKKTHLYAGKVTQSDPSKHKVEVVAVDFDEIKEEVAKKIAPNLNSIFDSETIKKEENVWTFSKPPNIFKNDSVGEFGVAWKMPSVVPPEIKKLVEDGWKAHQFNQYLSDLISVQRKLPDYRGDYCKKIEPSYSKSLPATSVIIIFHNEAWY